MIEVEAEAGRLTSSDNTLSLFGDFSSRYPVEFLFWAVRGSESTFLGSSIFPNELFPDCAEAPGLRIFEVEAESSDLTILDVEEEAASNLRRNSFFMPRKVEEFLPTPLPFTLNLRLESSSSSWSGASTSTQA